jgi:hypothetical protein
MNLTIIKSSAITKPINGNEPKYRAYREAWTRIEEAQKQGFYLEAITIEESIISDRLNSYFRNVLKIKKQPKTLCDIGKKWKEYHPEIITSVGCNDLISALDEWRKERNKAIHNIVHSETHADRSIENFLSSTKTAAENGEKLARAISEWCAKKIKETKLSNQL